MPMPFKSLLCVEGKMFSVMCVATILFSIAYNVTYGERWQKVLSFIPLIGWLLAEMLHFILPGLLSFPLVIILKLGSPGVAVRQFQAARIARMVRLAEE